MLLLLLSWSKLPDGEQTRYLTIEPNNEYKDRRVLPTPFQVMEECDRDERRLDAGEARKPPEIKKVVREAPVEQFQRGQILDATIEKKEGMKVTYRIGEVKRSNMERKRHQDLQVGTSVKVVVDSVREDGTINKIKLWEG
jgi:hypothetical protein